MKIGLELGAERFYHWVRRFGFGDPTGVDFPGEEQGIVPTPSEFSGSTMGNLPIGQGLSVTPMQMAAALLGDRERRHPARRRSSSLQEGDSPVAPPPGQRVISEQTAAQVRQMLEGVLAPGGTASEVSVPGLHPGGQDRHRAGGG